MLNYIWAGLIVCSLVFAMAGDLTDLKRDTYRNHRALPVTLTFHGAYDPAAAEVPVDVAIAPQAYAAFYGVADKPAASYAGTLMRDGNGRRLRFGEKASLPEPLATIRGMGEGGADGAARGEVRSFELTDGGARAAVVFEPVRFVKLQRITQAALDMAKSAVGLAIGLIGGLALWLGMLRIGEKAGLIDLFVKLVRPVLHPLFPDVPKDHPALGMIALNISAGMLGLGNAATPMGLKAMEELQTLNASKETATNPMVMLLALNTTCPCLIPSPTLLAILGVGAADVWLPTILSAACAMAVAIVATKFLGRIGRYRATDPSLVGAAADNL